jgi:CheY-like chemotaxis protein
MANRTIGEGAPIGELTGDIVVTSITDTGTGMPPEVVAKVFEPFFTTKESGKGTGLGLSMVYGFVRQSGGHVEIDSVPLEGTTIRIFLPRAQNHDLVAAVARPATILAPVRGDGETILVVEDDPKVRQVTVSTLRSLGFQVREAENGDQAVVSLNQNNGVDLVLSDIKMPGTLNGTELARQVQESWPTSRCCLTSAMSRTRTTSALSTSSSSLIVDRTGRARALAAAPVAARAGRRLAPFRTS